MYNYSILILYFDDVICKQLISGYDTYIPRRLILIEAVLKSVNIFAKNKSKSVKFENETDEILRTHILTSGSKRVNTILIIKTNIRSTNSIIVTQGQ